LEPNLVDIFIGFSFGSQIHHSIKRQKGANYGVGVNDLLFSWFLHQDHPLQNQYVGQKNVGKSLTM
jgi:hypothetical protein